MRNQRQHRRWGLQSLVGKSIAGQSLVGLCVWALFAGGCGTSEHEPQPSETAQPPAATAEPAPDTEQEQLHRSDPTGSYGAGITLASSTELGAILGDPATYEGRAVQVKGTVAEVCPMRGCWIDVQGATGDERIRVKVTDGDIVFPLSARGRTVLVEGTVEKLEMTEEQNRAWQKHLAEEKGEAFDPASVQGPSTTWRIRGKGARVE